MKILVERKISLSRKSEALVLIQFDGGKPDDNLGLLNERERSRIVAIMKSGDFKGRLYETHVFYNEGPFKRLILVGMGKPDEFNMEKLRGAYSKAARKLRDLNVRTFSTILSRKTGIPDEMSCSAEALVEGVMLGLYRFLPYKTEKKDVLHDPDMLTIITERDDDLKVVKQGAEKARVVCEAVRFTRDLVSSPANVPLFIYV